MPTSTAARTLAAAVCLVYFIKRDGTLRRMVTAPGPDGVTARGTMIRVFDVEKGEHRTVNAATIQSLRVLDAKPHEARPPVQHAKPRPAKLDAATARAWADDFDTGFRARR
jgi:hypothetical protein